MGKGKIMLRLDSKIEKEIERFIGYIRRMNSIPDNNQLELLLQVCINNNPDAYTSIGVDISGHVNFIRQMALRSDDELRSYLKKQIVVNKDPVFTDIFESSSKKRAIKDMSQAAKDLHADPRKWARKIDAEFRR